MKLKYLITAALAAFSLLTACDDDDKPTFYYPEEETFDMSGFAKGADVSWITQMEKAGLKFYNAAGTEYECMELMRELGMNSIRLRVWVNPTEGWCDADDVLIKAWRAKQLGFRLMIDFHYSDTWADPANQGIPAAWADLDSDGIASAVSAHTTQVLTLLKNNDIDVEWVQVGNETTNGMLWDNDDDSRTGKASVNMANYAKYTMAGYEAAKAVYPDSKVVVHLDRGQKQSNYKWIFDGLRDNGAKWDIIGMSLYPETDTWETLNQQCYESMEYVVDRYGCDVMVCEVGMSWDEAETAKLYLTDIIAKTKSVSGGRGVGVFYWEPQSYGNWNGYTKGAFDDSGRPTVAMDAFAN